jgi:hypothetical protein
MVRAVAVKTPVCGALRLREWEMGAGMTVVRRGRAPSSFIRVRVERRHPSGEGIGRRRW